jgi:hypothetical protein
MTDKRFALPPIVYSKGLVEQAAQSERETHIHATSAGNQSRSKYSAGAEQKSRMHSVPYTRGTMTLCGTQSCSPFGARAHMRIFATLCCTFLFSPFRPFKWRECRNERGSSRALHNVDVSILSCHPRERKDRDEIKARPMRDKTEKSAGNHYA